MFLDPHAPRSGNYLSLRLWTRGFLPGERRVNKVTVLTNENKVTVLTNDNDEA